MSVNWLTAVIVPLVLEQINVASKAFKAAKCKIDGWRPRQFACLSIGALEFLGRLLAFCETHRIWLTAQQDLSVRLIAKADCDRRPS